MIIIRGGNTMKYQNYIYEIINNEIKITKYLGSEDFVTIPETINHLPVTILGYQSISCKPYMMGIKLPDTLKHIEEEAISNCQYLQYLLLPDNLETIGKKAFCGCDRLKRVFISAHICDIDVSCFDLCDSLISIDVSKDNPYYQSIDGILYNKDQTILLKYPIDKYEKTFNLPQTITHIGNHAFAYNFHLKSIVLSNVETIGNDAFKESMHLESILLPENIQYIGQDAFNECLHLTIYVYKDTYAYHYVVNNNLHYQTIIRNDHDD